MALSILRLGVHFLLKVAKICSKIGVLVALVHVMTFRIVMNLHWRHPIDSLLHDVRFQNLFCLACGPVGAVRLFTIALHVSKDNDFVIALKRSVIVLRVKHVRIHGGTFAFFWQKDLARVMW